MIALFCYKWILLIRFNLLVLPYLVKDNLQLKLLFKLNITLYL